MRHHGVQQKGRDEILADYPLRVGQITEDNQIPGGYSLAEQRLDETEVPEDRAGMASGLASTTRFIGILVSVAALGAILSPRERFVAGAARRGLAMDAVREEAAHVTSADLAGLLAAAPAGAREALRSAALTAVARMR